MTVVTQRKATFDEREGKAFIDYVRRFEIAPDDLDDSGKYYIPVLAGQTVLEVRAAVDTLFDGTTPKVTVGDGADADGFLEADDVDVTSAGAFVRSAGKGVSADTDTSGSVVMEWVPNAYAQGKYYSAVNALVVTFTGSPTVGKLVLSVVFDGYDGGPDPRAEIKNLS